MSRNRFLLILKYLHFNNNAHHVPRGQEGYDPLFKIRPVYDYIRQRFGEVYQPEQQLSLDESTIGWRGNLHFRCYNPTKSHKFHMKAFVVAEGSSGYVTKWELYTGKRDDISEKGATYDVVRRLLEDYRGFGYTVYLDNYYSSPVLFQDLFTDNIMACGTVRPNRKGLPKEELKRRLDRGQHVAWRKNELMVLKWKDKKDVHMLSTCHNSETAETGRVERATGTAVRKPKVIIDYNKYMGGVDRSDQLMQYHSFERKTSKYYKKVFFHLLHLCQVQAYSLHKKTAERQMLHREFCLQVAKGLVQRALGVIPAPGTVGRGAHNAHDVAPGARKATPTKRCKVCQKAGVRKETRYHCEVCSTPLCIAPCFERFHTVQHYWVEVNCNFYLKDIVGLLKNLLLLVDNSHAVLFYGFDIVFLMLFPNVRSIVITTLNQSNLDYTGTIFTVWYAN